jgi:lamin tail-like protein
MLRTWVLVLWLLAATLAASLAARLVPFARGQAGFGEGLRLAEILAGPARDWDGDGLYDSRSDEWVEVINNGSGALDLTPYRIADADSTIRYELSGTLLPGAVLLVTGSAAVAQQRSLGRTASGLSLNNSGDTVLLFRVGAADTTLVDSRHYGSIEAASDRSTGWLGDPSSWALFDGLNRYTGAGEPQGTGCNPTPGARNGCTTPATETTWGKIKRAYLGGR